MDSGLHSYTDPGLIPVVTLGKLFMLASFNVKEE